MIILSVTIRWQSLYHLKNKGIYILGTSGTPNFMNLPLPQAPSSIHVL